MTPKTAVVPFIERLESMSLDELLKIMEREGRREAVDFAPWTQYPYKPLTSITLAASQTHLFIHFFVKGLATRAHYTLLQQPVWQDSCVEAFIADADGLSYHNFEINCIGTLLSSKRKARKVDVINISQEDAEKVIRLTSLPQIPFEESDEIKEWDLVLGIPFNLIGFQERPTTLKANFYKCADGSSMPHYVSWSPIKTSKPDFHRPEFFGTLQLAPSSSLGNSTKV